MNAVTFVGKQGRLVILGLVLLAGLAACAPQPAVSSAQGYLDTISVTGTGEASGAPDIASISLGISITKTSIAAAMDESNTVMEDITQALVDLGVAPEDIQTSNFSIWPEDRYDPNTGELLAQRNYRVENTLSLRVRDLSTLAQVVEAALENGANNLYGLDFSVDDSSELAAQARALAVADAQVRAEQLAQELGVTLGEARIVSEQYGGIDVRMESARPMGGGGGPPLSEGSILVSIQVDVTFDMSR
jgi:uncharacterized protein YggE